MFRKKKETLLATNLTNIPWRNAVDWNESVEHLVQDLIKDFASGPCAGNQAPVFNILLTGNASSGKSAFVNSILSLFGRRIVNIAEAGDTAMPVLTEQYYTYRVRHGRHRDPLPWVIGDTPGIFSCGGTNQVNNLLQIVDGHVPEGYKFALQESFGPGSPSFIHKPSSSSKAHCVAIVINAYFLRVMPATSISLLQNLRRSLTKRGIPTYVILTHVDNECKDVNEDLTNVYRSVCVRNHIDKISMFLDIPKTHILPIVNYTHQIELDHNIDILLLHAFSQLIGELKCKNMKKEIADIFPVTRSDNDLPFYNIFLVGQFGSGKSTFFNGINAILRNRMCTTRAEAGMNAFSLTKEFRMYKIKESGKESFFSTRICDTFGLKESADDDTDVRNVLSAIDGHVPDEHTFIDEEFHQDSPGYITSPALQNKAHCVCIVIDAEKVNVMLDNVWRKLRSVYIAVTNRGIPAKILLMKIDLVLGENEILENMNKNKKVFQVKEVIQEKLACKVSKEDIFPIKNYVSEIEFHVDMDFLLLSSLLHMLKCAQSYLENK